MGLPAQIKLGISFLCVSVATNATAILAGHPFSLLLNSLLRADVVNLVLLFQPLILRIVLIVLIWKRMSWARIAFALLTLLGLGAIPFLPSTTPGYWLLILSIPLEVAGLALLFRQPAASWYKRAAPAND